mgnify:CR=1 FL=1
MRPIYKNGRGVDFEDHVKKKRLIFTIRSKRSRFEAHLQRIVKTSKEEQIFRPI